MALQMPTFMTLQTFEALAAIQQQALAEGVEPSNVHVPWAGEQLVAKSRGIYYVGIAANAVKANGEQSFEARLRSAEDFCRELPDRHAPFWQFLNELTLRVLGRAYYETQDLWGWSNLLKIAGAVGRPDEWSPSLVERQRAGCVTALREEVAKLHDSLIVVASVNDYDVLSKVVPQGIDWDREPRPGCTYHLRDPATGNIFVHSYHPRYAREKKFFDAAVAEIVGLAQRGLSPF